MGNVSLKARGNKHNHTRRCGHKRSGHKRSGHKRSGRGRHGFRTRRHRRFGGGPNGTLSPLNPKGKDKSASPSGNSKSKSKPGDISLSKFVIIKEARQSQLEGDSARERKKVEERERTARREQFFVKADAEKRERGIRIKTRKTPIIHTHTHSTRTLKKK